MFHVLSEISLGSSQRYLRFSINQALNNTHPYYTLYVLLLLLQISSYVIINTQTQILRDLR